MRPSAQNILRIDAAACYRFRMGLDLVEIVIEVEDRYRIGLRDGALQQVRTVADFAAVVIAALPSAAQGCPTAKTFRAVRESVRRELQSPKLRLSPRATLTEVFPKRGRRRVWKALISDVGSPPPLVLSPKFARLFTVAGACLFAFIIYSLIVLWRRYDTASICAWLLAMIGCTWGFVYLLSACSTEFPSDLQTVGDLVRRMTAEALPAAAGERLIAEQRILSEVQDIIATTIGIPRDRVRPEARLIEDLRLD